MSTLEEFNVAVEAGLYNKFTKYGKMTMHFYHNEQVNLKIYYSYKTFFKQGSDETLFCIAFQDSSRFQLRAYLHALCLIFTIDANDRQYCE
jgi:hypothetical protein